MRRWITALATLLLPRRFKPPTLRLLGHCVSSTARIGMSLVFVDRLCLGRNARIGPFNVIICRRILLREDAYIGSGNLIRGPIDLLLGPVAAIGNRNVVTRAAKPISFGPAQLRLGLHSKFTSGHNVDCMNSIVLGDYATVAGKGSQLWTHGYVHLKEGVDRARVDGKILIGNNVYVGSHCCLTGGIVIGDAVTIGSHSSVAVSLLQPGLYVSQPLRYLPLDPEQRLAKFPLVEREGLIETVHWKGATKTDAKPPSGPREAVQYSTNASSHTPLRM